MQKRSQKAKDVSIAAMHNKVLLSQRGKVRLLKAEEYAERENSDSMTAWEGCLRMVWHLSGAENSDGISGCAVVARAMRDLNRQNDSHVFCMITMKNG